MSDNAHVKPAQEPASSPQVRWLSLIVSLLLIALGGAAIRELIVAIRPPAGWTSWLEGAPDAVFRVDPLLTGVLGALVALVGLWFVVSSLSPRRKRHRRVPGTESSVWVRPVDIARFATASAKRAPRVLSARSQATKKHVLVTASVAKVTDEDQQHILESIQHDLAAAFGSDLKVDVELEQADQGTIADAAASDIADEFPKAVPAAAADGADDEAAGDGTEGDTPSATDSVVDEGDDSSVDEADASSAAEDDAPAADKGSAESTEPLTESQKAPEAPETDTTTAEFAATSTPTAVAVPEESSTTEAPESSSAAGLESTVSHEQHAEQPAETKIMPAVTPAAKIDDPALSAAEEEKRRREESERNAQEQARRANQMRDAMTGQPKGSKRKRKGGKK